MDVVAMVLSFGLVIGFPAAALAYTRHTDAQLREDADPERVSLAWIADEQSGRGHR